MIDAQPLRLLNQTNRRLITTVITLVAAICLWFLLAYSIPFHPYRVHAYAVVPTQGCPGVPVRVAIDRTIRQPPGPGSYAGDYTLDSEWVNVRSGQSIKLPTTTGTFRDNDSGRLKTISNILRTAPTLPGMWQLHSVLRVEGRVLRLGREDIIPYQSSDLFRTLSPESEECS